MKRIVESRSLWRFRSALGLFTLAVCFLICCGGGAGPGAGGNTPPTQPISVSISPSTTSLKVGSTQQFSATVTNTSNSKVTWAVNDIAGGNSKVGTISSSGLYTASAMVPDPATVTIKATSQADATKSGVATVSIKLSITLSPQSQSVEAFHSIQFASSVSGVNNTEVTWSVNQIQGGNVTLGQIDSTGLYVAPSRVPNSNSITVAATSQADPTQSATADVTILPVANPPTITATSPTNGQTEVTLDSKILISFSEPLDPSTVNQATFTLCTNSSVVPSAVNYNPISHVVTLSPAGILAPGTSYTVSVSNQVTDPSGNPIGSPYQWSFSTQPVAPANGVVYTPEGTEATTLTVVSYGGQETTPDGQGNFTASLTPLGVNAVAAMLPGRPFGLLALAIAPPQGNTSSSAPSVKSGKHIKELYLKGSHSLRARRVYETRYQVTSSRKAISSPDTVSVDFQTTAESLVFMSPYFFTSDPTTATTIMTAIASDPNTATLKQALKSAWNLPDPLQDSEVQTALQNAIISIAKSLAASGTQQSQLRSAKSADQFSHRAKARAFLI